MFKIPKVIVLISLSICTSMVHAQMDLVDKIKTELKDELYPVTSLLNDYQRPVSNLPKFAVGEFRTPGDELRFLSISISEILRSRIQYVPGPPLFMPGIFKTPADAGLAQTSDRPLLSTTALFENLHQALGIETVLTGEITKTDSNIELGVELVNAENGLVLKQQKWKFIDDSPSQALIEITKWVYASLGVKLNNLQSAYLEDRSTFTDAAIVEFVKQYPEMLQIKGPLKRDKMDLALEEFPDFALFAIYALQARVYANNLDEAYSNVEFYKRVEADFLGHTGVALESYRVMEMQVLPRHVVSKRLDMMKQLVSANLQDPTLVLNYADGLVNNNETLKGIAILLEAVETWPNHYRLWWSLGWALNKHAWQVRGDSFWRDVPERAKSVFRLLTDYSDQVIDQALLLNSRNGKLWNMKLDAVGSKDGFSDEIIEIFDQAVKMDPTIPAIYQTAMNYAQEKWGGNALSRKHIIQTAEKNNPDAAWVSSLKRRYAAELDGWEDQLVSSPVPTFITELFEHPYFKWVALILGGFILLAIFILGRKSAFDEMEGYRVDSNEFIDVKESHNDDPVKRNR